MGMQPRDLDLEISSPGVVYDMSWLDLLDAEYLAELDIVRPREVEPH